MIALVQSKSIALPIIVFWVTIGLTAINQCFCGKNITYATEILYLILCAVQPMFCLTASVLVYDFLWEKRRWLAVPYAVVTAVCLKSFAFQNIILTILSILIGMLLYFRTSDNLSLKNELIKTRDTSAEQTNYLIEKNKDLLDRQDNEIYMATLRERNRIAREIHDNVGHMLTRSILQVGALIIVNKDEAQKEHLESLKDTLNEAMTSVRSSVHNLHDDSIDLRHAINEAVNPMKEKYAVNLDFDMSDNVPKKVKLCIIGVVKESLSNVVKHSDGNVIGITLREHPGFYQLLVEDNGNCSDDIKESGIGLSNMRDRIDSVDGLITFTPSEKGFKVFASIPKNKDRMI